MKVITAENLSKVYSVAIAKNQGMNFREMLSGQISSFFRKESKQEPFYALKDVSFEVEQGEVLGIMGKNGSGKSTFLKILSRITAPTSGRAIVRGRIASLLEVGTGFHAELTGRENIFMSGIILGMKRWEINKRFDDIVTFAGVGGFLDIPVKRYSSGMCLRLAFSVAAHLEAEILLVDEVLAVGDYEFEQKCLNTINDLEKSGRTILFVSHNMTAIQRLARRCIVLSQGKITYSGSVSDGINEYLFGGNNGSNIDSWPKEFAPGDELVRIYEVKTLDKNNCPKNRFYSEEEIFFSIKYEIFSSEENFCIMPWFYNAKGDLLFTGIDTSLEEIRNKKRKEGVYISSCKIPPFLFAIGEIRVILYVVTMGKGTRFFIENVANFTVVDKKIIPAIVGNWVWEWPKVAVRPALEWDIVHLK